MGIQNRYLIDSDSDGHWYIIGKKQEREFRSWIYWMEDEDGSEPWEGYDFTQCRIEHPSKVVITSYFVEI